VILVNVDYISIGQRIATRRKELSLTQANLAEKVDLSIQHISGVETANSIPSLETIIRICCALDSNAHYILFGIDDKIPNSIITEILRHLIVSSPQKLKHFLDCVEDFKNES